MNFWWSILQKGASIGHFGAWEDPTIRILKFFLWNWAVEVGEAIEVAEADEDNEAAKAFKACKITTEDFRVIQGKNL